MGQTYTEIPAYLAEWIQNQHMFWVASAPLSGGGHINISPKGVADTFHVASPTQVWYEDLSGSGAETIAHIRENGRITILFNAFEGPPRIARLFGKGSYHEFGSAEYNKLLPPGVRQPGSRAVIVVDVWKVGTTCGYSVPYYTFVGHRVRLLDWAAKKEKLDLESSTPAAPSSPSSSGDTRLCPPPLEEEGEEELGGSTSNHISLTTETIHPNGMVAWWRERNEHSLDGLPALSVALRATQALGAHKAIPKGLSHLAHRRRASAKQQQQQQQHEYDESPSDLRASSDIAPPPSRGQHTVPHSLGIAIIAAWGWLIARLVDRVIFAYRRGGGGDTVAESLDPIDDECFSTNPTDFSVVDSASREGPAGQFVDAAQSSAVSMDHVSISESFEAVVAGLEPPGWRRWNQETGAKISLFGYAFSFIFGVLFATFFLEELHALGRHLGRT